MGSTGPGAVLSVVEGVGFMASVSDTRSSSLSRCAPLYGDPREEIEGVVPLTGLDGMQLGAAASGLCTCCCCCLPEAFVAFATASRPIRMQSSASEAVGGPVLFFGGIGGGSLRVRAEAFQAGPSSDEAGTRSPPRRFLSLRVARMRD